jgi:2-keto-3-deoxy-L-rhamnonate aldolase RhmA
MEEITQWLSCHRNLSTGGIVEPRSAAVEEALTKMIAAAKVKGKFVGLFCFDGAQAKAARAQGVAFTSISTDALLLRAATRGELEKARG